VDIQCQTGGPGRQLHISLNSDDSDVVASSMNTQRPIVGSNQAEAMPVVMPTTMAVILIIAAKGSITHLPIEQARC